MSSKSHYFSFLKLLPTVLFIIYLYSGNASSINNNNSSNIKKSHHVKHRIKETVNGLAVSDVSVIITSTEADDKVYLRSRVIPSARTWMRYFINVFVVVDDTTNIRFAMRHCSVIETSEHTAFKCPNEPTYLLTRKCQTSSFYQHYNAIGCKLDEAINFIVNESPKLFSHTKFVIEADDDVFFRGDVILKWLAKVDKSGINHLPIVSNQVLQDEKLMHSHLKSLQEGKGGIGGLFRYKGCSDIFVNWYQPLMINHAALEIIAVGTKNYAFSNLVYQFNLGQDAIVGVLFWMYQLNVISFPREDVKDDLINVHLFKKKGYTGGYVNAVKHRTIARFSVEDECNPEVGKWPNSSRFNQTMAIGCGSLKERNPLHNISLSGRDMYDLWELYKIYGKEYIPRIEDSVHEWINVSIPVENNFNCKDTHLFNYDIISNAREKKMNTSTFKKLKYCTLEIPNIVRIEGYQFTNHSKNNNILKKWTNFGPKDCFIKGVNEQ